MINLAKSSRLNAARKTIEVRRRIWELRDDMVLQTG